MCIAEQFDRQDSRPAANEVSNNLKQETKVQGMRTTAAERHNTCNHKQQTPGTIKPFFAFICTSSTLTALLVRIWLTIIVVNSLQQIGIPIGQVGEHARVGVKV